MPLDWEDRSGADGVFESNPSVYRFSLTTVWSPDSPVVMGFVGIVRFDLTGEPFIVCPMLVDHLRPLRVDRWLFADRSLFSDASASSYFPFLFGIHENSRRQP